MMGNEDLENMTVLLAVVTGSRERGSLLLARKAFWAT